MYKKASRFLLQGKGRDVSKRVVAYVPKTRAQHRKWWNTVVRHAYETRTPVQSHSSSKLPDWLVAELESFGLERWIAYFDPKTGRKRRTH